MPSRNCNLYPEVINRLLRLRGTQKWNLTFGLRRDMSALRCRQWYRLNTTLPAQREPGDARPQTINHLTGSSAARLHTQCRDRRHPRLNFEKERFHQDTEKILSILMDCGLCAPLGNCRKTERRRQDSSCIPYGVARLAPSLLDTVVSVSALLTF